MLEAQFMTFLVDRIDSKARAIPASASQQELLLTWERHEQVQALVARILDEYVRQHFEESTRPAAKMMTTRRIRSLP